MLVLKGFLGEVGKFLISGFRDNTMVAWGKSGVAGKRGMEEYKKIVDQYFFFLGKFDSAASRHGALDALENHRLLFNRCCNTSTRAAVWSNAGKHPT
jgi:hypothetical protein